MTQHHRGSARMRGLLALTLLATSIELARGHDGHDHGADKAALEITSRNRASAISEEFQIVAVQDGETLHLTIDRTATNAAVTTADVNVTVGTATRSASRGSEGVYIVEAPGISVPGRHEIVVAIRDGKLNDLLITALDVPELPRVQGKPRILADTPSRLSDSSVFLPKVTQRLIGVTTATLAEQRLETAVTLVGRIIPNPNRSGVVQSTIAGRINAVDGALPRLGQPVKAGQVLAIVTPSFSAIDQTNVQQTAADLDQQIALAQNRVDQFRPLVRSNTLSPERLRTVELELENLQRRRATLSTSQRGAEMLTSPVDGVVAGMRALPGQVVTPQDIVFQIVDPKNLWIEALVFDPTVPDLAGGATATAPGTQSLQLKFVGRSRALQQLSTLMHFEVVDPPPSLNIGSPVTVFARTSAQVSGLVVSSAAVVTAPSGERIVWVHVDAERFQPRQVKLRPVDGTRVLIEAGLQAGDRVVVSAAELINQVR
ncbi:MAG: hypothetical protein RL291_1077 [Pseudomonadota bacterium]